MGDMIISGYLPTELGLLSNMGAITAGGNHLSGWIPSELGNMLPMARFRVGDNALSGTIPSWLGKMADMTFFLAEGNAFSGTIPGEVGLWPNSVVVMFMNNRLSGTLPSEVGLLTDVRVLSVMGNELTGELPTQLGQMTSLQLLAMQRNRFTGSLPAMRPLAALQLITLDVRWFLSPFAACIPLADIPPSLGPRAALVDSSAPTPLITCEALITLWTTIAVTAMVPILAVVILHLVLVGRAMQVKRSTQRTSTALVSQDTNQALVRARQAAFRLRLQVQGTLLAVGWALSLVGLTPLVMSLVIGKPDDAGVLVWLSPVGLLLLLLSLKPTDERLVMAVCIVFFVVQCVLASLFINELVNSRVDQAFQAIDVYGWYLPMLVSVSLNAVVIAPTLPIDRGQCSRFAMSPRAKLKRLWLSVRLFFMTLGMIFVTLPPVFTQLEGQGTFVSALGLGFISPLFDVLELSVEYAPFTATSSLSSYQPAGVIWIILALLTSPAVRGKLLRFLSQLGKTDNEEQSAAAIAALIGGSSIDVVLKTAAERFRALPVDAINVDDLLSNKDTGLFTKTVPTTLGSCEAFISHSWRDGKPRGTPGIPAQPKAQPNTLLPPDADGNAKHKALCDWATRFVEHETPPLVWLDKACIVCASSAS